MIALPVAVSLLIVVLVIAFFVGRTMRPAGLPHSEEEKQRLIAAPWRRRQIEQQRRSTTSSSVAHSVDFRRPSPRSHRLSSSVFSGSFCSSL